jgi:hypothetical protein
MTLTGHFVMGTREAFLRARQVSSRKALVTHDASPRIRTALAMLTLLVPFAVVLVSWALWRPVLPLELASHWSGTGVADDSLPTTGVLIGTLIATGIAGVGGVIACVIRKPSARGRRNIVFMLGFLGGLAMSSWVIPAFLTIQAGSALEAVLGWWIIPMTLLAGYGIIPALLLPMPQPTFVPTEITVDSGADADLEAMEPPPHTLIPGVNDTYSVKSFGTIFVVLMAGLFVLGVLLYGAGFLDGSAADNAIGLVVLGLGGFTCAAFSVIRVTVDGRGLRVTSGLFGIPLKRIRLDQIDTADGADLRATEWGGWGYRITAGRSAIILRSGPGLIVTKTDGKEFAMTLANPEVPAALLNALRDRRG